MSEANREAVIARVRAMMEMAERGQEAKGNKHLSQQEQDATFTEGMRAAEMAGELMRRYRLTQSDLELQQEPVADIWVERNMRVKWTPADVCIGAIDRYCGVKCWRSPRWEDGRWVYKLRILGLKPDAEMAKYLYELIMNVIHVEQEIWAKANLISGRQYALFNRREVYSFQQAMAGRIKERLSAMAGALDAIAKTASGTALVVVKAPIVKQALTELQAREGGWKFRTVSMGGGGRGSLDARAAGRAAGDKVNLSRPVGGGDHKRLGR